MELFYGGGGCQNPDFCYRFLVETVTNEMYQWCQDYPLNGPFERWYVKHRHKWIAGGVWAILRKQRQIAFAPWMLLGALFSQFMVI